MFAYDKYSINSVREKDENGFLHVKISNITKEAVNPYYGHEIPNYQELGLISDKIYYGYRPLNELRKAAKTFNNLNLLSQHVEDGADKDIQHLIVGSLGDSADIDAPYLTNSLAIKKQTAIDDIENDRKKELSSAYRYTPVIKAGFFNGERYDFIMTNIRGNHVALVKEGRAGSDVVVADSNTIKKGVSMKRAFEKFKSKLSAKGVTMDESIEEAVKEVVREEIEDALEPEIKVTEKITGDAEEVDKRELIRQIGGILKSMGASEENIRLIVGKVEEAAYNNSERGADDSEIQAKDAESFTPRAFEEGVKYGEHVERKRDRFDGSMDAKTIELNIMNKFKEKYNASRNVKTLIGEVDIMAFDSAEEIYAKALQVNGYDPNKYNPTAYKGMVEILKNKSTNKSMSFDHSTITALEDKFPGLSKIKIGEC